MEYKIAFATESGDWHVVETFDAADDDDANRYAETNYRDEEWYILDAKGVNING